MHNTNTTNALRHQAEPASSCPCAAFLAAIILSSSSVDSASTEDDDFSETPPSETSPSETPPSETPPATLPSLAPHAALRDAARFASISGSSSTADFIAAGGRPVPVPCNGLSVLSSSLRISLSPISSSIVLFRSVEISVNSRNVGATDLTTCPNDFAACASPFGPNRTKATTPTRTNSGAPTPRKARGTTEECRTSSPGEGAPGVGMPGVGTPEETNGREGSNEEMVPVFRVRATAPVRPCPQVAKNRAPTARPVPHVHRIVRLYNNITVINRVIFVFEGMTVRERASFEKKASDALEEAPSHPPYPGSRSIHPARSSFSLSLSSSTRWIITAHQ